MNLGQMNPSELINKKKLGFELKPKELDFMVKGFNRGDIPDYQMSAFLMAVCLKGLNSAETSDLTKAIVNTGKVLDLGKLEGIVVDKHSTGGVGDKTSLVLAPLLGACHVKVAKISGRCLGHTGGTIDKLESFPGFNPYLSVDEFITVINEVGMSIICQTEDLALADKKIYALRDVTATVDSIPLIASSIMSKKIAAGTGIIALDVKVGKGAFMKDLEGAKKLAEEMIQIGTSFGKKMIAVISDMNQPLGNTVGNSLEAKEAVQTLKGSGPDDLLELCLVLGSQILLASGKAKTIEQGRQLLNQKIKTGEALSVFNRFLREQGVTDISGLIESEYRKEVISDLEGYVSWLDSETIGKASVLLGAGRKIKGQDIDRTTGIELDKKRGDYVKKGDVLARIYYNPVTLLEKIETVEEKVLSAYEIVPVEAWGKKMRSANIPLIYKTLNGSYES